MSVLKKPRTFKDISSTGSHQVNRTTGRNERIIQNCRPISLSNVDLKIISTAFLEKRKKFLPDLTSSQQTTNVKNKHIGESGRLISDFIEIARIKKC